MSCPFSRLRAIRDQSLSFCGLSKSSPGLSPEEGGHWVLVVHNARTLGWGQDRGKDREVCSCLNSQDTCSAGGCTLSGRHNVNCD